MENTPFSIQFNSTYLLNVPQEKTGMRLDIFLTDQFPSYSRSYFQWLIGQNYVQLNEKIPKASTSIKEADQIKIIFPPPFKHETKKINPDEYEVKIVFEHPHFYIISKPAGLMVHPPSPTHTEVTLVDWLLNKFPDLKGVGIENRPGIVHRLDKDTSGLLIIPRTNYAHKIISDLFRNRKIKKTYLAVVKGHPEKKGRIDFNVTRDPIHKNKMVHATDTGRSALTHYEVVEYFPDATLVQVNPITGRTHQIRVHFAGIGHPLLGDLLYGKKSKDIKRQALHASGLEFTFDGEPFAFTQEPPEDFKKLIEKLKS